MLLARLLFLKQKNTIVSSPTKSTLIINKHLYLTYLWYNIQLTEFFLAEETQVRNKPKKKKVNHS